MEDFPTCWSPSKTILNLILPPTVMEETLIGFKLNFYYKYDGWPNYIAFIIFKKSEMNTFIEILTCDGTALYDAHNHEMEFNSSGRLEVLLSYDGDILLKLGAFEYQINPKNEIVCDRYDPQFEIVLYFKKHQSGSDKWVFKINEHADEVYSCLNEKFYVRDKDTNTKLFQSEKERVDDFMASRSKGSNTLQMDTQDTNVQSPVKKKKEKKEKGKSFCYHYGSDDEEPRPKT